MMRITKIEVSKMHGKFDYDLHLNRDERITIVHDPNGCGKSSLFKLLYMIFNPAEESSYNIYFDWVRVHFDNGRQLYVSLKLDIDEENVEFEEDVYNEVRDMVFFSQNNLSYTYSNSNGEVIISFVFDAHNAEEKVPKQTLEYVELAEIFSGSMVQLINVDRTISKNILEKYRQNGDVPKSYTSPLFPELMPTYSGRIRWINKGLSEFMGSRYAVESASEYIKHINYYLFEQPAFARSGNIYERDYAGKIVATKRIENPLNEDVIDKYRNTGDIAQIKIEMEKYIRENRCTADLVTQEAIKCWQASILATEKFLERISLLQKIVNKRFATKELVFGELGLEFRKLDGKLIPAEYLSSGEKQLFVILCEILLRARENSLILLDEPEISLHVAWQQRFLQDLEEVLTLNNVGVLIATHSPLIINDRWDLTVDLGGDDDEQI